MEIVNLFFSLRGRVRRGDFWYALLVLLSALAVLDVAMDVPVLLTQPILTRPGSVRILFGVPVDKLKTTIVELQTAGSRLEHIYDY